MNFPGNILPPKKSPFGQIGKTTLIKIELKARVSHSFYQNIIL
jgi:hypothetical protein